MTEDDIVVFTFGLFLYVIITESRITLPNHTRNLEERIAKVDGAFL